jgi:RimJ/RimL family protein N-acetyltransferase
MQPGFGARMINRTLFMDGNIKLTALDPEKDAEVLSRWTNSPSFVAHHFDGIFRPYMVSEIKKKLKEMLKKASESGNRYYFAVRAMESGRLVGLLKIGYVSSSNQATHLFLDFVDEESFEKYADAVLKMALNYIFMELSLHRVSAYTTTHHEHEIALLEKAGFLRESQRRQAIYYNGRVYDELVYGLLRTEWKRAQEVNA